VNANHPSALDWRALEGFDANTWSVVREEAHWAMQVLAAIGYSHIEPADDDSQSNAGWVDGMQILVGRRIEREPECFASLSPSRMILALHEPGGETLDEFALAGATLDEAYAFMESALGRRYGADPAPLNRPPYEMPRQALATGKQFVSADASGQEELARWFHNANLAMRDLRARTDGATGPRVWPHHFDMGMLISLDPDHDAESGRSIGIGMTPGDASLPAPYWYVNPWPAPKVELPAARIGQWHREGWTGLVLDAKTLLEAGDAQEELCRSFLDESVAMCRGLLGA